MAEQFPEMTDHIRAFIEAQPIFFVGSAAAEGRVNVSPKGGDSLRVLGPNRILWRNLTGSGNETAGHLAQVNRMTLMWCSFDLKPLILRCFGTARAVHTRDADWAEMDGQFPTHLGARQVYDMTVDLVQTSCGYAVPRMAFQQDRDTLDHWTQDKGPEGLEAFQREKNQQTIDGLPTGLFDA